jgi:hypothetical protein
VTPGAAGALEAKSLLDAHDEERIAADARERRSLQAVAISGTPLAREALRSSRSTAHRALR